MKRISSIPLVNNMETHNILTNKTYLAALHRMLKERGKPINYNRNIVGKDLYTLHNISSFLRVSKLFYDDFVFIRKHVLIPIILNELENTLLNPNHRYYHILKSLYEKCNVELNFDLLKKKYLNKGTQILFSAIAVNHFREQTSWCIGNMTRKEEVLLYEIEEGYIKKRLKRI